jgi:MSHA pilin protein MshC
MRWMCSSKNIQGFSIVELIVVLVLISILSYVALPRFFDQLTFQEWGFTDELTAALRYSHKLAIATGCDTRASVTASGYQLNQRASCKTGNFTQAVLFPGGDGSGYSGSPPSGISLSAADFYFDSQGRPRDSASGNLRTFALNISVGSRTVTVEAETGFVHRP